MRFRRNAYYIDTETCGFHGLATLIQYAYQDGKPVLHNLWDVPVGDTLDLIEEFCAKTCVFFNAAYDWFHLAKIYTMFSLLPRKAIPCNIPMDVLVQAEKDGRDGACIKPANVMDLMLHSRKGEFQTLMARHDIRVTKVPTPLAQPLADILEGMIELDGILFAKRSNPNAPKWGVYDRITKGKEDVVDPNFRDVILRFKPARGLKYLAQHCLGLDPEFNSFMDVYPERDGKLFELGFAPFALAVSSAEEDWKVYDKTGKLKGRAWPVHIHGDIIHWRENEEARRYGRDDVTYTRLIDEYFKFPEAGDNDSVLACMVAAVRWHGFTVDIEMVAGLLAKSREVLEASPVNINKPKQVKRYIREVMDESEAVLIDKSTKKANLEKIRDTYIVNPSDIDEELGGELCVRCLGDGEENGITCPRCEGCGFLPEGPTRAAMRAAEILICKVAAKEVELYSKLLKAGRFHAAFKVIGTLSSRMAGGEGLNAQGIKGSDEVRSAFPLMWEGRVLCGGDFDGFEVTIADAVFGDPKLRQALLDGVSIHVLMARQIYPDKTVEQIKASKGLADGGTIDMYTRGKQSVFSTLYGGDANTIHKKLGIDKKVADAAFDGFQKEFPGIKEARDKVASDFEALQQHGEIGTGHISYKEPAEYIETFLGFRRYFTLESKIAKALYDLAHNTPKAWRGLTWKVVRRDREQTPAGAVASALYGAAFQIQASTVRAANNHLIQSPGAVITKELQRLIWDLQPHGVNEWYVAPMNIHDEVLSVTKPEMVNAVTEVTVKCVESFRDRVPLIGMSWVKSMDNWAGKKGGGDGEAVALWGWDVLPWLRETVADPGACPPVYSYSEATAVNITPHGITGMADGVYVEPMDVSEMEEMDGWEDEQDTSSLEDLI